MTPSFIFQIRDLQSFVIYNLVFYMHSDESPFLDTFIPPSLPPTRFNVGVLQPEITYLCAQH
jgi:hypothetical protein